MPNLQLDIKPEPAEDISTTEDTSVDPYDDVSVWDFLVARARMFVIENRDLITVALVLTLGFGVIWTVRVSNQPTTVSSQAAGVNTVLPTAAVTILVVTPTPPPAVPTTSVVSPTPLPSLLPTMPLTSPIKVLTAPTARPTNPYAGYLPTPP